MRKASLKIERFAGRDERRNGFSGSAEAVNVVCENGALKRCRGTTLYCMAPSGTSRIFSGCIRENGAVAERLIACGDGKVYVYAGNVWQLIGSGFESDDWDSVNYRHGENDCILMTNAKDGLYIYDGTGEMRQVNATVGGEPIRFARLTLAYERLWGGSDPDHPDRVYWSSCFDPENWEPDAENPENGGGFVDAATFDAGRVREVACAFDDVLICKDNSLHRLNGTYPGDFVLTRVNGGEGPVAKGALAECSGLLYFLGKSGLCVYDGMNAAAMKDGRMQRTFERINRAAPDKVRVAVVGNTLYLAVPLDGAVENTHIIVYSPENDCWGLMELAVKDFCVFAGKTMCICGENVYLFLEGNSFGGNAITAKVTLPIQSAGGKRLFTRRLVFPAAAEEEGALKITARGDDSVLSRTVVLPRGRSMVCLHLGVQGRLVELEIENVQGCGFELPGGMTAEFGITEG